MAAHLAWRIRVSNNWTGGDFTTLNELIFKDLTGTFIPNTGALFSNSGAPAGAFDGNGAPGGADWSGSSLTTPKYVGIIYSTPQDPKTLEIISREFNDQEAPGNFEVQFSDDTTTGDDGTWTTTDSHVGANYVYPTPQSFVISNPEISIVAPSPATESEAFGTVNFTVNSDVNVTADTMVLYSVSGTAVSGADYTALSGAAIILNGTSTVQIPVALIDDLFVEVDETLTVTITAGSAYTIAPGQGSATLTITSNDSVNPPPVVTIANSDPTVTLLNGTGVLTATAITGEDGDISGSIEWTVQGDVAVLATGANFQPDTSISGTTVYEASVTDIGGLTGSSNITYIVELPTTTLINIVTPSGDVTINEGDNLAIVASAIEDDLDVSAGVVISSDLDGALSVPANGANLSVGVHLITASYTLSGGGVITDTVTVTVLDDVATILITQPLDTSQHNIYAQVNLSASALTTSGVDLSNISWTANGVSIGFGKNIAFIPTQLGSVILVASIFYNGVTYSDTVNITVVADTALPSGGGVNTGDLQFDIPAGQSHSVGDFYCFQFRSLEAQFTVDGVVETGPIENSVHLGYNFLFSGSNFNAGDQWRFNSVSSFKPENVLTTDKTYFCSEVTETLTTVGTGDYVVVVTDADTVTIDGTVTPVYCNVATAYSETAPFTDPDIIVPAGAKVRYIFIGNHTALSGQASSHSATLTADRFGRITRGYELRTDSSGYESDIDIFKRVMHLNQNLPLIYIPMIGRTDLSALVSPPTTLSYTHTTDFNDITPIVSYTMRMVGADI